MARPSRSRALSVWVNGLRAGTWRISAAGIMEFEYAREWMHSPLGRPLSLSLPFGVDATPLRGEYVRNFFENLLPDNEAIRQRIGARFRTASLDAFDLLAAVGRDCVGALQILPADATPAGFDRIDGRALDDAEIERLLVNTVTSGAFDPQADPDDFRISLAGAQEKTALLRHGGRWLVPHGATPTTHIFKMPLGLVGNRKVDMSGSVENEWLCMQILDAFGLPVAATEMLRFGRQKVLCVERFDRQPNERGTAILRLPQEDFCQTFGLPPHLKYESDGGPGLDRIAERLRQSANADADIHTVLTAQVLFWMLAAPDGHAKNFSLRLLPRGRFRLTPLYDVMSIWPVHGDGSSQWSWHKAKLAMSVPGKRRRYRMKDIRRRHFDEMARECRFASDADAIVEPLVERTPAVIDNVRKRLPNGFPARVARAIFDGLQQAADRLADDRGTA